MNIQIISVGKIREDFWIKAEQEYLKRLNAQFKITHQELPAEKPSSTVSDEEIKKREAAKILKNIAANSIVIALDEKGREFSSPQLAEFLKPLRSQQIVFIIGGHLGLDQTVLERADFQISLSRLTFPHQMVRVFLAEQLYRVWCLWEGRRYHR